MAQDTFFESPQALENAEVMLDVCRQEYAAAGYKDAVQSLQGLDVTTPAAVQLAYLTVKALPSHEDIADVRRYTLNALVEALRLIQAQQRLAS